MKTKFHLALFAVALLFCSCFKKSIADAMLDSAKGGTATLRYEINGNSYSASVRDADNRYGGYYTLYCQKSSGYYEFGGETNGGSIGFFMVTDSLKPGNYKYTASYTYVTDFNGQPCYIAGGTDNMSINVTSYKGGRVSGNFTGQLTPSAMQTSSGPVFGTYGSVLIKNGSFSNVPVVY